ncbi:MAG: hypothetical protein JSV49_00420 [Thermoplasmata archaeon]|nr:MAG: hypothetical protein JSV49_00420 [Thermoplasmata archaeon]
MPRSVRIYAIVLIALLCVPAITVSVIPELNSDGAETVPNFNDKNTVESESSAPSDEGIHSTRSSSRTQDNFRIESTVPVSMSEINDSWVQDDWSGGAGQELWSDSSKFSASTNLIIDDPNAKLRLDTGDTIEAWKTNGEASIARYYHGMVWAEGRDVFYIFGGKDENYAVQNTLYEYNPATETWTQKGQSGAPAARVNMLLVWDSHSELLWVYGGSPIGWSSPMNDLWLYNPSTDAWSQRANGPAARSSTAGAFNPNTREIIVYGGYTGDFYNPSAEVYVYNTVSNIWSQKQSFTSRYDHAAAWVPKTNSMWVYGGVEKYVSGQGYVYADALSEYLPSSDTWVNHTSTGIRNRAILAWDSYNEKLILNSGLDPSYCNKTEIYDIDTDSWQTKLDGPYMRDFSEGAFDTVRNQFVTFGGRYYEVLDEYWTYLPNVPGFKPNGDLKSSVFNPGHRINPRTISYNLKKQLPQDVGEAPVKIRVAGSDTSPSEANKFIGPNGGVSSYFSDESGEPIPDKLKGSKYLAYEVNLSTQNPLFSPEMDWIKIDYYTYPQTYSMESPLYETGDNVGLPLRHVSWISTEPEGTEIEVYIRQASTQNEIETQSWELVTNEQVSFGYKSGKYFQYKTNFGTTEPGHTPVLDSITFTFNNPPLKPEPKSPENNTWISDSDPYMEWEFADSDANDFQVAFKIAIGVEESFSYIYYMTDPIDSIESSFELDTTLDDGTYYWKVRTMDNYGSWGAWSDLMAINIDTTKPEAPKIDCYSHPLESLWYADNQPRFDWNEPEDLTGIEGYSYLLDRSPEVEPPEEIMMTSEEFVKKHTVYNFNGIMIQDDILPDGIWYFHLKAVDTLGTWSEKATRTVKIDTLPAELTDFTPIKLPYGESFKFSVDLNDSASGIALATISWKYTSEVDYRYDELLEDKDTGLYTLEHQLESRSDSYIEYYISVNDYSNPVNELRYPVVGHKKIEITDGIPPTINEVTGNTVQNPYTDLRITVRPQDNVGISEAKIYFNEIETGRTMLGNSDGTYTITIDRMEVQELADFNGGNVIHYYIKVTDNNGNSIRTPEEGTYDVTIKELETGDDPEDEEETEKGDMSKGIITNATFMGILIIIVAIVLFVFIRKQSEKIHADRHKLRMAIADMHENTSQRNGAPLLGDGSDGETSPSPAQPPVIDITASSSGTASSPTPAIGGPATPVTPQLPPAKESSQTAGRTDTGSQAVNVNVKPTAVAAAPSQNPSGKVEVSNGLFVSVPSTQKQPTAVPASDQPKKSYNPLENLPDRAIVEPDDKKSIWTPPGLD